MSNSDLFIVKYTDLQSLNQTLLLMYYMMYHVYVVTICRNHISNSETKLLLRSSAFYSVFVSPSPMTRAIQLQGTD